MQPLTIQMCTFSWYSTYFFIPRPQSNSKKCYSQKLKERKQCKYKGKHHVFTNTNQKVFNQFFCYFTWEIVFSKIWVTIFNNKKNPRIPLIKVITASRMVIQMDTYIHIQWNIIQSCIYIHIHTYIYICTYRHNGILFSL